MTARHLQINGIRTTIRLEQDFWDAIESIAGGMCRQWIISTLDAECIGTSRVSHIRVSVLKEKSIQK